LLFPLEFEALAVIYCLDAFRWAAFGNKVTVITDHSALTWLFSLKVPGPKLLRWTMRVLEYDALIQHRAGKLHGNADMLSRSGTMDDEEPATVNCEDYLREPPEEHGSVNLMVNGAELTVRSTRFAVVDGYVIDLAAGPPAKIALVITNGNDSANDMDLVVVHKGVKAHDISLRGPVHAGDGVHEEQSSTFRAVYQYLQSQTKNSFSEDATAQVCIALSHRAAQLAISATAQTDDLVGIAWHTYGVSESQLGEASVMVNKAGVVREPSSVSIEQLDNIFLNISVAQWAAAQRADAALAPWFDFLEQQRLPSNREVKVCMLKEADHFVLTVCKDGTVVLQHRSQHVV
jgi:RNase H-like domain found in reverse transcriptase